MPPTEGTLPWILGYSLWNWLFAPTGAMVWGYFTVRGIAATLRQLETHREREKFERIAQERTGEYEG